jgi:hypothetical protein
LPQQYRIGDERVPAGHTRFADCAHQPNQLAAGQRGQNMLWWRFAILVGVSQDDGQQPGCRWWIWLP